MATTKSPRRTKKPADPRDLRAMTQEINRLHARIDALESSVVNRVISEITKAMKLRVRF